MSPPRKSPPGSNGRVRGPRARRAQSARVVACSASEQLLIAASGVDAQAVLIVTRDMAGDLRLWSDAADPFVALAMIEFARIRLKRDAKQHDDRG